MNDTTTDRSSTTQDTPPGRTALEAAVDNALHLHREAATACAIVDAAQFILSQPPDSVSISGNDPLRTAMHTDRQIAQAQAASVALLLDNGPARTRAVQQLCRFWALPNAALGQLLTGYTDPGTWSAAADSQLRTELDDALDRHQVDRNAPDLFDAPRANSPQQRLDVLTCALQDLTRLRNSSNRYSTSTTPDMFDALMLQLHTAAARLRRQVAVLNDQPAAGTTDSEAAADVWKQTVIAAAGTDDLNDHLLSDRIQL